MCETKQVISSVTIASMARFLIFLAWLPVLSNSAKTHITVRTVKEELKVENVEHPKDGVIVRIIDPPQNKASSSHESETEHEAEESASTVKEHEDHGSDGHESHDDAETEPEHAVESKSAADHGHGQEHGQEHTHKDDDHAQHEDGDVSHGQKGAHDGHAEHEESSHQTEAAHAEQGHERSDHGHGHAGHAGHGGHADGGHGHGEEGHAREGHGHAPDEKTLTASYMLIGGVTLVMAMFYLVQHPDLDIRYYSWNILTLSACIFIAVLASDVVNQVAKRFLFSHIPMGAWGNARLCFGLAIMWFLCSQLVTAALSGAFGEEAKEPKEASSEEERRELEELWEQREVAMKCWGGLVAHCAGFAIVATLASLQDSEPFASSPFMSLLVVPGALVLVTLLYRLAALIRKKISEMDDGVVSRGEALWDEISEEAENESLCLGLSFASVRSISFFAIGAMPDTHFHIYADVPSEDWHRGWMVLFAVSIGSMILGIATFKLKEKLFGGHGHDHGHESHQHGSPHELDEAQNVADEDDIRVRALLLLTETFIMMFSWGMLSCAVAMLNAFMPELEHHLIGHLIVALVVSALSCLMLLCLDKVADAMKGSSGSESTLHIINHIILAHGLLIGISWEVCFALGMHAISHVMDGPNVDIYLAVFLCLVVVPAYRLFMLPELRTREAKIKSH